MLAPGPAPRFDPGGVQTTGQYQIATSGVVSRTVDQIVKRSIAPRAVALVGVPAGSWLKCKTDRARRAAGINGDQRAGRGAHRPSGQRSRPRTGPVSAAHSGQSREHHGQGRAGHAGKQAPGHGGRPLAAKRAGNFDHTCAPARQPARQRLTRRENFTCAELAMTPVKCHSQPTQCAYIGIWRRAPPPRPPHGDSAPRAGSDPAVHAAIAGSRGPDMTVRRFATTRPPASDATPPSSSSTASATTIRRTDTTPTARRGWSATSRCTSGSGGQARGTARGSKGDAAPPRQMRNVAHCVGWLSPPKDQDEARCGAGVGGVARSPAIDRCRDRPPKDLPFPSRSLRTSRSTSPNFSYACRRTTFALPPVTYAAHWSIRPRRFSNRLDRA